MTKTKISKKREALLKRDLEGQIAEALGATNRYFAGMSLSHPPNDQECFFHYVTHGGPCNWRTLHPWPVWYKGRWRGKKL